MVNIAVSHTAARGSIPRVGTYRRFLFVFEPSGFNYFCIFIQCPFSVLCVELLIGYAI